MYGLMLYSFNMPIFFFISGYFAYKENLTIKNIVANLWTKFLFLVLPAIFFLFYFKFAYEESLIHIITNGVGRYWFTIALFLCFLLYYIIRAMVRSKTGQVFAMMVLSIIGIGSLILPSKCNVTMLELNGCSKYFQYFALGVIAKMYYKQYETVMTNQRLITMSTIGFFMLLVVIFQCYMPSFVYHVMRDMLLRYLGTFMVVAVFFCNKEIFSKNTRINRVISYIGRHSLPIYLLQYFFIPDLRYMSEEISQLDVVTVNLVCIAYTAFNTALCALSIWLLSNSRFVRCYVLGQKK